MKPIEQVQSVMSHISSHSLYPVETVQKYMEAAELPIKLPTSWKVTKSFIATIERDGGFCSMAVGTAMMDGMGALNALMKHFGVESPRSFIGRGKQFYEDLDALQKALVNLPEQPVVARTAAKMKKPVAKEA